MPRLAREENAEAIGFELVELDDFSGIESEVEVVVVGCFCFRRIVSAPSCAFDVRGEFPFLVLDEDVAKGGLEAFGFAVDRRGEELGWPIGDGGEDDGSSARGGLDRCRRSVALFEPSGDPGFEGVSAGEIFEEGFSAIGEEIVKAVSSSFFGGFCNQRHNASDVFLLIPCVLSNIFSMLSLLSCSIISLFIGNPLNTVFFKPNLYYSFSINIILAYVSDFIAKKFFCYLW